MWYLGVCCWLVLIWVSKFFGTKYIYTLLEFLSYSSLPVVACHEIGKRMREKLFQGILLQKCILLQKMHLLHLVAKMSLSSKICGSHLCLESFNALPPLQIFSCHQMYNTWISIDSLCTTNVACVPISFTFFLVPMKHLDAHLLHYNFCINLSHCHRN